MHISTVMASLCQLGSSSDHPLCLVTLAPTSQFLAALSPLRLGNKEACSSQSTRSFMYSFLSSSGIIHSHSPTWWSDLTCLAWPQASSMALVFFNILKSLGTNSVPRAYANNWLTSKRTLSAIVSRSPYSSSNCTRTSLIVFMWAPTIPWLHPQESSPL